MKLRGRTGLRLRLRLNLRYSCVGEGGHLVGRGLDGSQGVLGLGHLVAEGGEVAGLNQRLEFGEDTLKVVERLGLRGGQLGNPSGEGVELSGKLLLGKHEGLLNSIESGQNVGAILPAAVAVDMDMGSLVHTLVIP
jgi:hypothetical protein